jgi:hypothetical protein
MPANLTMSDQEAARADTRRRSQPRPLGERGRSLEARPDAEDARGLGDPGAEAPRGHGRAPQGYAAEALEGFGAKGRTVPRRSCTRGTVGRRFYREGAIPFCCCSCAGREHSFAPSRDDARMLAAEIERVAGEED